MELKITFSSNIQTFNIQRTVLHTESNVKHFGVVKKAYFQLQLNHIVTRRKSNKVTANYSLPDIMNSNSLSAVSILICEQRCLTLYVKGNSFIINFVNLTYKHSTSNLWGVYKIRSQKLTYNLTFPLFIFDFYQATNQLRVILKSSCH